MVLQRGNVDNLMRQVQEAGSRACGVSSGSYSWFEHELLPNHQLGSGLRKPVRWQALRSPLLDSAIVLMIGILPINPENQTREKARRSAGEVVKQQSGDAQKAEMQNAAQPQNEAQPQNVAHAKAQKVTQPQKVVPRVKPQAATDKLTSLDYLDQPTVRAYVRRNVAKIRYCYEKQRLAKATLTGTVQAQFLIMPDGTVGSSKASGLDDDVASCVAGVIKNIEFPRSGGAIQVTYPFHFVLGDN